MTHCMNLHHEPFELIAQGLKTIELRLLDEKRKKISVGDKLVFTDTQVPSATIECRVIALYLFDSFDDTNSSLRHSSIFSGLLIASFIEITNTNSDITNACRPKSSS